MKNIFIGLTVVAFCCLALCLPALAAPSKAKYTQCLDTCLDKQELVYSQALSCVQSCAKQTLTPAKITIEEDTRACYDVYDQGKSGCTSPVCRQKLRKGFMDCINRSLFK